MKLLLKFSFCVVGVTSCSLVEQKPVWVRSDQIPTPRSSMPLQSSLSARDLGRVLGCYDDVYNLKVGPGWRITFTYEEQGMPGVHLWAEEGSGSYPVMAVSRTEGIREHYWIDFSYDTQHAKPAEAYITPPKTKYDYRWATSGRLGEGRWVVRRWTDDIQSTGDPSDLRFKARVVMEIKPR